MKTALSLTMLLFATMAAAQGKPDEEAIRSILQEEVAAWNKGDAQAYSQHFAVDGTFTNIRGMFFTGHQAFLDRHEEIFKGMFRGTVLRQDVVSLRFVRPEVAVVETLTWVSGFSTSGPPPGTHTDAKGRLRTRLLQVMVKDAGEWRITVYHNVDIKPGVTAPEALAPKTQDSASDAEAKAAAEATVGTFGDSWNRADGAAYGANYWPDAELIDPSGNIVDGRAAIVQEHVDLWAGIFKRSRIAGKVRRVRRLGPNHILVDFDTELSGLRDLPPGAQSSGNNVLRNHLKHILEKRNGEWKVLAAQNTFIASK